MPTLEGLSQASALNTANAKATGDNINEIKMQAISGELSDLAAKGDFAGAYSLMLKTRPDMAGAILPQITSINPQLAQSLSQAQSQGTTQGQYNVTSEAGSNPRQLLDTQIQGQKDMAETTAQKGPSDREKRLSNSFNQQMAFKYQQSAETNPTYKAAISVINEMPTLKGLLDDAYKNGGQSLAMLGPRIAKGLAGEVGVLTEQDVTRYVSNPALARSILSRGEKAFEGKLTAQDYANLMRLGTVMEKNAQEKMNKAYKQAATKMSRNLGIPLDDAELLVNPNIDEATKAIIVEPHKGKTENMDQKDPNQEAMDWLAANPNDPRAAAIKQKLGIK